jgi:chromate transporter
LEWGRIGCIGFGGPPTHIALLRDLCVTRHGWVGEDAFEDAIAACNLLPGPASTQLAIFLAWSVAGPLGAIVGGAAFIAPGLALVIGLSMLFFASAPPLWVLGAGAGAGAAVAAVALHSGLTLVSPSWQRSTAHWRWLFYAGAGLAAAATLGPWLVLVLLGCGGIEVAIHSRPRTGSYAWPALALLTASASGGLAALAWVAFKVGALAYGGGFVIIPLIRSDAVNHYHWMTNAQFLDAVALGQVTPGPVVLTVAAVGYAAAGIGGALFAALIVFAPSLTFVLAGAPHFNRLRDSATARAFLSGAGPAAIGAIIGVAIPLALSLPALWQFGVLAAGAVSLFLLRRGVVVTLIGVAAIGIIAVESGAPLR